MSANLPLKSVHFNDPDEFLAELRQDRDQIERQILRLTIRRRYTQPFVSFFIVATAALQNTIVKLEHRVGETFAGDERANGVEAKVAPVMEKLTAAGRELGLDIRAGVYE